MVYSNRSHKDGTIFKRALSKGSPWSMRALEKQAAHLKFIGDETAQMPESRLTNKEISLNILVLTHGLP